MLARVDAARLRSQFPACGRAAYLNAGSIGPLPRAAVAATRTELERAQDEGRWIPYFERSAELRVELRRSYAALIGALPEDVAVTTSTTEGVARVLTGLDLRRGDEVVTSDEEHPGVYGPLAAARALRGVSIRVAPLAEVAQAVGPRTRLAACSHVSWLGGAVAPSELADLDVPVLLDGAQGAGAVPVDVGALGCAFYAASGQKWLCGPGGTGMLYVAPEWRERLAATALGYANLADPGHALESPPHPDARRHDTFACSAETMAAAGAAYGVLASEGWEELHGRARELATRLAEDLRDRGREVLPRGETTLVAWRSADPGAELERLTRAGVMAREIAAFGVLRASVGAWNDEADLERLLAVTG
jgi:selenocysteine lyase/cysteine desulfurase